jgi:hypothetical protein
MVTPKNLEQVFVYKDPELAHAANQSSVITLQNGEVLMGFNEERYPYHSDSGQSCFIKSRDGGKTWDPATKKVVWPYTDFGGNWDCAFAQISDGTILMHTRVCNFIAPWGIKSEGDQTLGSGGVFSGDLDPAPYSPSGRPERLKRQTSYALLKSKDNGNTWTDPIPVNTSPVADSGLGPYSVGGSGAAHIIELPDGGLIFPLGGSVVGVGSRAFLMRSDDGGDNWEYFATMAHDPADIIYWVEPGMTRLQNGNLVCLYRTSHVSHSRQDNMWFNYSDDDGVTWNPPEKTELWGFPADILQLQDGRVLAVYGYRDPPWGVRGCLSNDGMTWEIKNQFVIREGGMRHTKVADQWYHIGYPSVTQLKDGTIITGYHEYSDDEPTIQFMACARFTL